MKRKLLFISLLLLSIILIACGSTKEKPFTLKSGAYGFKKATITNLITKEVKEKSFDDILGDKVNFKKWGWLFNFSVGVSENTEYVFKKDNRCFILNEGLAYEVIDDNSLKLHFLRWQDYDYGIYDINITFGWQKTY